MSTLTTFTILDNASNVAGDTESWFAGVNLELRLVTNDFTPDPSLVTGDLTYAANNGLSPKVAPATAPTLEWDPVMGVWGIRIWWTGGQVFTCVSPEDPPVTVYGWAIVNTDISELICTERFPEPVVFDHVGVAAHVPEVVAWFAAPFLGDKPVLA